MPRPGRPSLRSQAPTTAATTSAGQEGPGRSGGGGGQLEEHRGAALAHQRQRAQEALLALHNSTSGATRSGH